GIVVPGAVYIGVMHLLGRHSRSRAQAAVGADGENVLVALRYPEQLDSLASLLSSASARAADVIVLALESKSEPALVPLASRSAWILAEMQRRAARGVRVAALLGGQTDEAAEAVLDVARCLGSSRVIALAGRDGAEVEANVARSVWGSLAGPRP